MKTDKRWDKWMYSSAPSWAGYLMYALLALGVMLTYKYWDGKSMTVWSTVLLDCTFDGKIYDFYEVIHQNHYGSSQWNCGFNYLALIP